ncbi:TBC1 domain family member 16 [Bacillus rossius redtenbacheri]|uniref:TBC1 domain family member 16 n=1 Tax=Bacillus rossius redtenbacheri TaxID=93214 RepID=UPI002FDE9BB5
MILTMSIPNLFKKASSLILGKQREKPSAPFADGEVVFSKNNVCVHPPSLLRQDCDVVHHPGYLTVTCHHGAGPTLRLSWIPNTTLRKNPATIENPHASGEACESLLCSLACGARPGPLGGEMLAARRESRLERQSSSESRCSHCSSCSDASTLHPSQGSSEGVSADTRPCSQLCSLGTELAASSTFHSLATEQEDSFSCVSFSPDPPEPPEQGSPRPEDEAQRSPSLSSACSLGVPVACADELPTWMRSPELVALQHNLAFPDSNTASPVVHRALRCRRFSVDLSQMRSLRLFFNDAASTCGQLVVASRESQYKILHFHHGALDRLASVLHEWNFLLYSLPADESLPYRHFMVCRPEVGQDELHPEEGGVAPVDAAAWLGLLNDEGQLEDDLALRKGIFFGGLDPSIRHIVWPFLLHLYTFQSTTAEREQLLAIRRQEYDAITRRRLDMDPESQQVFWRTVQCTVEKDVVRTDRANPFFAGEDNPNVEIMKSILLNYAVYNPGAGYTQGMSDLLAPVLMEIRDESDAFWCFVGLMQKAIFVCTPTDNDMDKNLSYLRELIRLMVPDFHQHLQMHTDAMELLFCHRWILLCFKREFPEAVALKMWEACWANYLTDYFHLFLCLAIVCVYSADVIAQGLRTDEMLLHFSSLAMFMDGELILRKARGLLHQFRQKPRIPCTLAGLCRLCGPGMWDSTHAPVVECTGDHPTSELCPHRRLPL